MKISHWLDVTPVEATPHTPAGYRITMWDGTCQRSLAVMVNDPREIAELRSVIQVLPATPEGA